MPGFNIIVIILRWTNNSDNLKTILKWMSAISSMESYPVGKESLSSGQGPLTLRKKVLGARDRGATATERHAQQEWRTPLPKITELASYMAEASRFRSSCCFPSSNVTCHSHGRHHSWQASPLRDPQEGNVLGSERYASPTSPRNLLDG